MNKKVNKINVYMGTVKKCLNVYNYNRFGDTRFVPMCRINSMVEGSIASYTEIVSNSQILVKQSDELYAYYDESNKMNVLSTKPYVDGDYFVDSDTLVPYFGENITEDTKISIKKLKV